MSSHRWLGLDGLRGVAVIAVVLFHAGVAPGGFMGVDVFFVLSGFLITRILRAEHARTGTIRLRRFTARRLLRLYPALLAVCIFVLTVSIATQRAVPEILQEVVVSLTYTSNLIPTESGLLDHTWTLSLEEQFYLVWPPLLLLGLVSKSAWGWVPAGVVLVAVAALDLSTGQMGALHTYVRAMGLPLGCVLAFAGEKVLHRLGYIAPLAGVCFLIALFVPLPPPAHDRLADLDRRRTDRAYSRRADHVAGGSVRVADRAVVRPAFLQPVPVASPLDEHRDLLPARGDPFAHSSDTGRERRSHRCGDVVPVRRISGAPDAR